MTKYIAIQETSPFPTFTSVDGVPRKKNEFKVSGIELSFLHPIRPNYKLRSQLQNEVTT